MPKLIVVLRNKLEIAIDGNYVQKVSITFLYPEAAREGDWDQGLGEGNCIMKVIFGLSLSDKSSV